MPDRFTGQPGQAQLAVGSTAVAAANNQTLAAAAGKTTYITGFTVTGGGATGASVIAITVTGLAAGTITFYLGVPAGAGVGVTPLVVAFPDPLPASALNTAIVVNVPSFGTGNLLASATATGFQN